MIKESKLLNIESVNWQGDNYYENTEMIEQSETFIDLAKPGYVENTQDFNLHSSHKSLGDIKIFYIYPISY